MSFVLHRQDHPKGLHSCLRRLAEAEHITVIAGAGCSMEAGFPSWTQLVRAALADASSRYFPDDEEAAETWASSIAGAETPPGCFSVVRAALGHAALRERLPVWLYGSEGQRSTLRPGPIHTAIAKMYAALGDRLTIATTNFDLLIEDALEHVFLEGEATTPPHLRNEAIPRCDMYRARDGQVAVRHLHGYVGAVGDRILAPVVTDEDYRSVVAPSSWQSQFFRDALTTSACLFIGTSLLDTDIREFIARHSPGADHKPVVLFAHDADDKLSPDVRRRVEQDLQERWRDSGVDANFLDFYGDFRTFVDELTYARTFWSNGRASDYESLFERCSRWIADFEEDVLCVGDRSEFFRATGKHMLWLDELLRESFEEVSALLGSENWQPDVAALSVWICTRDGKAMRRWLTSDRAQYEPAAADHYALRGLYHPPALIARRSNQPHVAVNDNSRWRYTVSYPLDLPTQHGALPLGALTLGLRGCGGGLEDGAGLCAAACARQVTDRLVALVDAARAARGVIQ